MGALSVESLNALDSRGNTPSMLLLKLSRGAVGDKAIEGHLNVAKRMVESGADLTIKDAEGWSAFDEAVTQGNMEFAVFLFEELRKVKIAKWSRSRAKIITKLRSMKDFFVEIKWKCKSTIPLVSKFAPSDTFRLWKVGGSVRLDFTCVGWKAGTTKRRNMSVLFLEEKDGVYLVNRSKKTVMNLLEELHED